MRSDRRLVISLATTTTVAYGALFYAFGILLVPMADDLGWPRSVLAGAFTCALLVHAILTVPVGRWLDRHRPRRLLLGGAVGATGLLALWASAGQRVVFFAVWIGLGATMAALFYEPAFTILTKRLDGKRRHSAVTSVTLVAGLASTIFGPLTAALEQALGWRGAVWALAAILGATTIPIFAFAVKDAPESAHAPTSQDGHTPREVFRTTRFWVLAAAYLLSSVTTYGVAVHVVPYLLSTGWTSGAAASVLGGIGLVQVVGRSFFTRLTARWSAGQLGTFVLGAKTIGLAALVLSPTRGGVVLFLLLYGAANGLQTLTRTIVVADLYGTARFGSISSVISSSGAIAGALSPFLVAAAIELAGAYRPALWGLVAISLASAALNEVAVGSRATRRHPVPAPADLTPVPPDAG